VASNLGGEENHARRIDARFKNQVMNLRCGKFQGPGGIPGEVFGRHLVVDSGDSLELNDDVEAVHVLGQAGYRNSVSGLPLWLSW